MARYSKLIAAIIGNIIGIIAVWLAMNTGMAECSVEAEEQVCTILGFSTVQITAAVLTVVNSVFVWRSPANQP